MCLIVDANVASLVFSKTPDEEFEPIWKALRKKRAIAFMGGELSREYARITSIRKILVELNRQGVLRRVSDQQVDELTKEFREYQLRSDDPHILALASVSNARLLCSHDQNLHTDFTNPVLLKPPGSIYQNSTHKHLIRKHCKATSKTKKKSKKT